jgi:uncharacterized protein (UPF0548 family)
MLSWTLDIGYNIWNYPSSRNVDVKFGTWNVRNVRRNAVLHYCTNSDNRIFGYGTVQIGDTVLCN